MKLRLMGSPDLIAAWAARLGELGIYGRTYPSRYGDNQMRWYADLDDRLALALVERLQGGELALIEPKLPRR